MRALQPRIAWKGVAPPSFLSPGVNTCPVPDQRETSPTTRVPNSSPPSATSSCPFPRSQPHRKGERRLSFFPPFLFFLNNKKVCSIFILFLIDFIDDAPLLFLERDGGGPRTYVPRKCAIGAALRRPHHVDCTESLYSQIKKESRLHSLLLSASLTWPSCHNSGCLVGLFITRR